MGQVFLGYSPAGRAVAVKVIHPELAKDPMFRTRFRREVAAAKAVSGAYTAPVTAAGPDDDPPWLATAFVPGPSLAGVIAAAGPLPEPSVWKLTAGLVEALQAVHAAGLVHRDLKPANVLLATDGPRVIDFGISAAFEGTRMTSTGLIIGTPSFMSPEQAEGARVGPESDVFSLGCVIVFAATGAGPFGDGQLASVLYRVVHTQPALDGVPRGLREVAAACLAKAPADRPTLAWLVDAVAAGVEPDASTGLTSFWPMAVTRLIGSYQDQLSTEMPAAPSVAETVAPQSAGAARAAGSALPPATMAAPHAGAAFGGPGPLTVGAAELAVGPGALTVGAAGLGLGAAGALGGGPAVAGPAGAGAGTMAAPQGSAAPSGVVAPSPGLAASPGSATQPPVSAAGSAAPADQAGSAGPIGAYAGPIYGTYGMPASGSPAAFPDGYGTAVQSQFPVLPGDLAGRPDRKDGVTRRRLLVALGLTAAAGAGGAAWELTHGSKPGNLAGSNSNGSTGRKPPARATHHAATQQTPSPGVVASGKRVWSYGTGNIIESPVVVANGVVYFGSTDKNVYAVNARSGARAWSYPAGDAVQTGIAVAGGAVYASSFEGDLYRLDASSGTKIWTYPAQSVSVASVAVAGGTVYTSGLGTIIMALSASNGAKKWDLTQDGQGMRGIAVAGRVVYLGSSGGDVYALHGGSGKAIWTFPANGEITSGVAFADGVVYAGSFGQSIYALNASNGRQVWTYQTGGQVASGIAVANGIVYAASADNNLYALSASGGKVVWQFPTSGQVQSGITVANGRVYAGDSSGNLYALHARTGHKIWAFSTSAVIESGIAVVNGIVYFGGGNVLYAVGA
jgi:outer membrane protein assembly factor BamB